jgi:hypothetical protein
MGCVLTTVLSKCRSCATGEPAFQLLSKKAALMPYCE